jgi:putative ABC transport system permease protein
MGIYLKFYNKINKDTLQEKIKTCVLSNEGERFSEITFQLQPLRDIYLHSSDVSRDIGKHGNISNVYGFAIVALLILIIACFNYINLTTARANSRAKEVGVRKAIGANRSKLAFQFLGESFFTTLISFLIALILVEIMVQPFNELLDKNLNLYSIPGWQLFFIILIAILIISVFAGSFPAFILSRFQAIKVLKGITSNYENKSILSKAVQLFSRRSLVVFQFAVAVALIIASNIVYNQLELIRTMDLGIKTDHLVVIENPWDSVMTRRYDNYKISISNSPDISKVSAAFNVPPGYINNYARTKLSDNSEDQDYHVGIISVDYNYFEAIGAEIIKGRNFNSKLSSDEEKVCIINETAAKLIGLPDPVGKSLTGFYDDSKKEIIGIVKDIHFTSIHEKVEPVAFFVQRDGYPPYSPKIIVKTGFLNIKSTIRFLEDEWNKLAPQWPFQYYFMDQKFEKMYRSEQNISKLMQIFTFLAILISFSGLFGLMLFIVESRTKEIGIRKVFGASVNKILYNLMKEFFKLILFANLFAWPVIYIIMDKWLQNFEYQAGIKLITFVIAGLLTLLIAFATVFYQSLKTANSNPVDSLKYE